METESIWKYYILALFILYLILGICYMYFLNRSYVKKKSYTSKKLQSMRREIKERFLLIGIGIPIIILISGVTVRLIYGEFYLGAGNSAFHFFVLFLLLCLPFTFYDQYKTRKKYKKFAVDSKAEIIVDFKHRLLRKLFNPVLELLVYPIYCCFFLYLETRYHISFNHILVLCLSFLMIRLTRFQVKPLMKDRLVHQVFTPNVELAALIVYIGFFLLIDLDYQLTIFQVLFLIVLYFTVRTYKYQNNPTLKNGYSYTFLLMVINHMIMIFYLIREMLMQSGLMLIELTIGLFLLLVLFLKVVYYISNFGQVQKELAKEGQ